MFSWGSVSLPVKELVLLIQATASGSALIRGALFSAFRSSRNESPTSL